MAQSAPATAQTIEAYVGETMDAARMGPIHWQVLALGRRDMTVPIGTPVSSAIFAIAELVQLAQYDHLAQR